MSAATGLERSLARLQALSSPFVGVVREVDELLASCDDARLVHIVALAAETGPRGGGGGYARSREAAVGSALGEVVERYAGGQVPDEQLVLATASELGPTAVAPDRFALFAVEQYASDGFPFVPFTADCRIRWVEGHRLGDGLTVWLPAQLVYLPWRRRVAHENAIGYSTSSGLACGASFESAALAALLELVERDAFMITWHARLSLPRLDWSDSRTCRVFEERYLAPAALRHEIVDLSGYLEVPTALAVVHADGRGPGELGVGAASAPTIEEAWRKALAEAYAVRSSARMLIRLAPDRVFEGDFGDVVGFDDHIHLYSFAEHARAAEFLDAATERRKIAEVPPLEGSSAPDQLDALLRRLAGAGLVAYAVDVTSPDIRDAGLHVVRAVVPELCPLDVRQDARFLGGRRLREAAFERGLLPARLTTAELNPYPHPFP